MTRLENFVYDTQDTQGNVTQQNLPGGGLRNWTYESTFNQPTQFTDEMTRATAYTISPSNGTARGSAGGVA